MPELPLTGTLRRLYAAALVIVDIVMSLGSNILHAPANTVAAHWVWLSEKKEATRTDAAASVVYLSSVET